MNISGLVVHAMPEKVEAVRSLLTALSGVEVHAATADGRLVVTVEDEGDTGTADTLFKIHGLEGVVTASLVYNYIDADPADEEEEAQ